MLLQGPTTASQHLSQREKLDGIILGHTCCLVKPSMRVERKSSQCWVPISGLEKHEYRMLRRWCSGDKNLVRTVLSFACRSLCRSPPFL